MPALPRPASSSRLTARQTEADPPPHLKIEVNKKPGAMGLRGATGKGSLPPYAIPAGAGACLLLLLWMGGVWPFGGGSGDPNTLAFLSIGDFGAASKNQKAVAAQMAATAAKERVQFVVSLGDNVYDKGVKDVDDPLFYTCFEDVYSYASLQKPWLMTLGDHDHRGSVAAQLAFSSRSKKWQMPSPYYSRTFQVGPASASTVLQIIVTDSVALEAAIVSEDPANRRFFSDYNLTVAGKKAGKKQLKWLKETLATSQADWKIVVGHRPVLTSAVRPRFPAEAHFAPMMQPILEQFKVDCYMNGHDHVGQHLEEGGVVYLGSGVGGYGNHDAVPANASLWVDATYSGFMLHKVTPHTMVTEFINSAGKVLHSVTISHKEDGKAGAARGLRLR